MAKHSFGEPLTDDDVLEIQGIEYRMMPIGMRAMRRLLDLQKKVNPDRSEDDPITEEELDMSIEMVLNVVRPEERDRLRDHIEESVPPSLLVQIVMAVMSSFTDLDPTQPGSSSDGSQPTGPGSADGVPVAELTPSS